jgi:simple sugar transport system permease protein
MLRLELRAERSRAMVWLAPVIALALTLLSTAALFTLLGVDAWRAMGHILLDPFATGFARGELLVKATPLIVIALGLSLGFRAGVWNIGAEGQFTAGALAGGAVALALWEVQGSWVLPLSLAAGVAGGMAWAAVPAYLRTRWGVNEILVSLMLTYVAVLLLSALVYGPLRSPDGENFPESRLFSDSAKMPMLLEGTRAHVGVLVPLVMALLLWALLRRHVVGLQIRLFGEAPRAAHFAGFSERSTVWLCLMISGAAAGLAGTMEALGPVGQLVPALPAGYGFTAIIVAFLGRQHPLGVVIAGLAMAVSYIGSEAAQVAMSLPAAITGVFQGLLLFFLLALDVLVLYRPRWGRRTAAAAAG